MRLLEGPEIPILYPYKKLCLFCDCYTTLANVCGLRWQHYVRTVVVVVVVVVVVIKLHITCLLYTSDAADE